MKKLFLFCLVTLAISVTSCDEESKQRIAEVKTVAERIKDLNKTMNEIKGLEESEALMRDEAYLLEYEYPVREDESYVITYRFQDEVCFEIKMDTYLNKASFAEKVKKEVLTDMANNDAFEKTTKKDETYKWLSTDNKVLVELKTQHIERGTVNLIIKTQ